MYNNDSSNNSIVTSINKYKGPTLFFPKPNKTNNVVSLLKPANNIIRIYRNNENNGYSIIKVCNNRMYRVVGPNLIEILMLETIPASWVLVSVFKNLVEGNLRALVTLYNNYVLNGS